jgi:hypothetical protein
MSASLPILNLHHLAIKKVIYVATLPLFIKNTILTLFKLKRKDSHAIIEKHEALNYLYKFEYKLFNPVTKVLYS